MGRISLVLLIFFLINVCNSGITCYFFFISLITSSNTLSTDSCSRQSQTLLPPQPSKLQGRHGKFFAITRPCGLFHGPHASSDDGPKIATVGVFVALAICMGTESMQIRQLQVSIKAASSFRESLPARLRIGILGHRDIIC